jgi:L-2-hydroxyglutarate oxidase
VKIRRDPQTGQTCTYGSAPVKEALPSTHELYAPALDVAHRFDQFSTTQSGRHPIQPCAPGSESMSGMGDRFDLAIVGGGIVGLATSLQALRRWPGTRLLVLEKEPELAMHQSAHNSGVLHSGVYYRPGSLKSHLCREGKAEMERFAEDHGIPFVRCGKLIVAVREDEMSRFRALKERGTANGVEGLDEFGPDGIRELEPHVTGIRALLSPGTGIIDFRRVSLAMAEDVRSGGGEIRTGHRVTGVRRDGPWQVIHTSRDSLAARNVIGCAGLFSDRLAARTGARAEPRIIPFRGSYLTLRPEARGLVRRLIYPVPDPSLPFLGVHFTPRIDGEVWVGPNAVLAFAREGYSPRRWSVRDLLEMFTYPGFWRLARHHYREGLGEMRRAIRRETLIEELRRYVPEIERAHLGPGPAGVRAQAVDRKGGLVDDFSFSESDRVLHVRNAPSPGATASLAIGRHIAERAADRFGLP